MALTDFEIIHAWTGDDDPEIACMDGRRRVLAMVTDEAWDDVLELPPGETIKTIQEKNFLSQQHLDVLKGLIQARYSAGQYEMLHRLQSSLPLIKLLLPDLMPVRAQLSRAPLDMFRNAHFARL